MAKDTSDLSIVRATRPPDKPPTHWDFFCDEWVYDADARRQKIKGWDWEEFDWHRFIPASNYETAAAVDPNGRVEGFISVEPGKLADKLVVQYLQVAPWNYDHPGSPGERRGVGTMLLRWAVHRSEILGTKGALALSSTKKSEGFYPKLGFQLMKTFGGQKVYELQASEVANFRKLATLRGVGAP